MESCESPWPSALEGGPRRISAQRVAWARSNVIFQVAPIMIGSRSLTAIHRTTQPFLNGCMGQECRRMYDYWP